LLFTLREEGKSWEQIGKFLSCSADDCRTFFENKVKEAKNSQPTDDEDHDRIVKMRIKDAQMKFELILEKFRSYKVSAARDFRELLLKTVGTLNHLELETAEAFLELQQITSQLSNHLKSI